MNGKKGVGVRVDPSTWSVEEWKKVTSERITATRQMCPTAGFIFALEVTADATGPGVATIYDSHMAVGKIVYELYALANAGHGQVFKVPIYCSRGIHVVLGAHADSVSIQWMPWNP